MIVRPAAFGNEVLQVAELLEHAARGKSSIEICRSRADACILRSRKKTKMFHAALVSSFTEESEAMGFLYASERGAFDLCPGISFVEVLYLCGRGGRELLEHLRTLTAKRILVQSWRLFGRMESFERLIRPLQPQEMGRVYQI